MRGRITLAWAASALTAIAMLVPTAWLGWATTIPAATTVGAVVLLALLRPSPGPLALIVIAAAAVSLLASLAFLAVGEVGTTAQGLWGMLEVAAMLVLLALVVRVGRGPLGVIAAVTAVAAHAAWLPRFVPDAGVGALLLWSLGTLVAVVIGGYPRLAERRMHRRVAQATERQRHRLDRDLHDFVAHDISGILAQAQAARFATPDDPEALRSALADIEGAAQHALGMMDRTMALLRSDHPDGAPTAPARPSGLDDLAPIIAAYAATTAASVETSLPAARELAGIPDEVGEVVQRVVVEALTNVRRHAPAARSVSVAVALEADRIHALIVDDGGHGARAPRPGDDRVGGTGLAAIVALVDGLHGALRYGPSASGWLVEAEVPLAPRELRA